MPPIMLDTGMAIMMAFPVRFRSVSDSKISRKPSPIPMKMAVVGTLETSEEMAAAQIIMASRIVLTFLPKIRMSPMSMRRDSGTLATASEMPKDTSTKYRIGVV